MICIRCRRYLDPRYTQSLVVGEGNLIHYECYMLEGSVFSRPWHSYVYDRSCLDEGDE